jgi:prefoldin subunit 5
MFGIGSTEIVIIFVVLILVVIIGMVYLILKARDDRIKTLYSRIDQLEKDKNTNVRLDTLEKRYDDIQKRQ